MSESASEHRRRVAGLARDALGGRAGFWEFVHQARALCPGDGDVDELIDLMTHEPQRGGLFGASPEVHDAHMAEIGALVRRLEGGETQPAPARRPRDIAAEISYLPSEHGGRASPVTTGYRPQFYYRGHDWDAQHEYETHWVYPGETVRAFLVFLSPAEHWGRVRAGMPFLIREGQRTVAYGVVTELLDLEQSARRAASSTPGR